MTDLHILLDPVSNFWKCPKKGFKKLFFWHFLTKFFDTFGLSGSIKTFSKVLGVGLHFVYIDFFSSFPEVYISISS